MWLGGGLGHARVSLGPQQQAVCIDERREVTGILGDLTEEITYNRHDGRERMGVQPFSRLVLVEQARRGPVRIDAGLDAAAPGPDDHVS